MRKVKNSGITGILTAVVVAFGASNPVKSDIILRTSSPDAMWVQGQTYTVNVTADSTQHPTDEIVSAEWDVVIANSSLIPTGADLPDNTNNPSQNPEDFFFNYQMLSNPGGTFNYADPDFTGGESNSNNRATFNFATGPQNVNDKLLASYHFIVPSGLTGTYSFGINNVLLFDNTLSKVWTTPDYRQGAGDLDAIIINQPITIVRDEPADFDKNGSVDNADYQHFAGCLTGPGDYTSYINSNGCADADFDVDNDVDARDYMYFQEQFTGAGNPVQ